ncbi:MAG: hypothetical protein DVB25_04935 [Verrucomicrobia bacterium]|nr:MAG: hypothetical protein DVB25_04935 [Verrucomicrobiota bacterium]
MSRPKNISDEEWELKRAEQNRQQVEKLTDAYVAQSLKIPVRLLREHPELLEAKRNFIRTKRFLGKIGEETMPSPVKPQSLESLYPQLAKNLEAIEDLKQTFGEDTPRILEKMIAGTLSEDEDATIDGVLTDLIHNGWHEDEYYGRGSDGHFSITVRGIDSYYFIQASEFDDIGYFTSVKDALAYAETEYKSYGPLVADTDAEDEEE